MVRLSSLYALKKTSKNRPCYFSSYSFFINLKLLQVNKICLHSLGGKKNCKTKRMKERGRKKER